METVLRNLVLATFSAVLVLGFGEWSEDAEDLVSTVDVDAVLGRTASLPCDVTPDTTQDRVYMVLWFRKSGGKPIYSFDVRGRPFNKALQWSDAKAFGPRAYFATVARPAALTLSSVQLDDEGVYRCRVDFKNSPTRNFQIRLSVIVPPHQMLLYDKSGADVSWVVGPLEEGATLVIVCEVRGGQPKPVVSWLINGTPAPQFIGVKTDTHVVVNRLEVPRVTRSDLNTTYKCRATNTKLVPPWEKTVRLEMNLAPLSVSLLSRPQQLVSGTTSTLSCLARGSRPPAQITWFRANRSFEGDKMSDYSNETWSGSSLVFTPSPIDNNVQIKCIASNQALPTSSIDDHIILNVVYSPLVTLSLGSTLNPQDIKEGDDVYFECNVRANPREHRISWYHNGRQVTQNMTSGIILSTRSLVLQRVTRREAGSYSCRAANTRGEKSSATVELRVQYSPVCIHLSPQIVGAAIDESLRVRCSVHADPAEVTFLWQFNNSGESFHVSPARYGTINGSTSELSYIPASERDYGALTCRGSNAVGQQSQPCVFQIVPAARPAPPRNCTLNPGNETTDEEDSFDDIQVAGESLIVRCITGYDGGLPQLLILEAIDVISSRTKFNITANETDGSVVFLIPSGVLLSNRGPLRLMVYSKNDKGASDRITLQALAYQEPERRTDGGSGIFASISRTIIWAIVLTLTSCSIIILTGGFILRKRRSNIPIKQQLPELQLNSGNGQYVVAYTLKHSLQAQPDILNSQLDEEIFKEDPKPTDNIKENGVPQNKTESHSDKLYSLPIIVTASEDTNSILQQPTTSGQQTQRATTTLSRREHQIAEEVPGPESCV